MPARGALTNRLVGSGVGSPNGLDFGLVVQVEEWGCVHGDALVSRGVVSPVSWAAVERLEPQPQPK